MADERSRQAEEGRRLMRGDGQAVTVETIEGWLRGTLRLLAAEPDALELKTDKAGEFGVAWVIVPGTSHNAARILGKTEEETGMSTIKAVRTIVSKLAGRAGLMAQVHVEAERRGR